LALGVLDRKRHARSSARWGYEHVAEARQGCVQFADAHPDSMVRTEVDTILDAVRSPSADGE